MIPVSAPAPSITFCSQACLFTGEHPAEHGLPGNQFFDRFAYPPRHFAFDVGDTLAVDDAVRVFTDSLAAGRLQVPTIYEQLAEIGKSSVVAGNMYAQGASTWIKPSLANIARFTKGGNLFGMSSREYDQDILNRLIAHLQTSGLPDLITMYFMGLDHDSHALGPDRGQMSYLVDHIDPMLSELIAALESHRPLSDFLVALFSDHGQIGVIPDDRHSLKMGFPFDRELGHFFEALGLDVHDFPGEDPACDAVLALNGGLAYVYLQNKTGHWADAPNFARDVLPVGRAFWEAHLEGKYAPEVQGALAGVLIRDVERAGWAAPYEALTPEEAGDPHGSLVPLGDWFAAQPVGLYLDPVNRLNHLASPLAGDIVLISNYADGYYFGSEISGVHGGLHPDDSLATLAYGWPGASLAEWVPMGQAILDAIGARCRAEQGRVPTTADMWIGLQAAISKS